jgi:AcrR family transcriptional regulator
MGNSASARALSGTQAPRRGRPPGIKHRRVTRARVLDAAERLFIEKGFRATSVQEIAAEAGYTTGAVYSSYRGKDDLFLHCVERRTARQQEIWREALASVSSSTDAAAAMGAALQRAMPEPAWLAVYLEFLSYAARDPHHAKEMARRHQAVDRFVADLLATFPFSSPLPLERLAPIVVALMDGFSTAAFADPKSADSTLFSDAVALLLGVAAPAALRRRDSPKAPRVGVTKTTRGPASRTSRPELGP